MPPGDLSDLRKPIRVGDALREAMRPQIAANVRALLSGGAPGGKTLTPLRPGTVRQKGRATPGVNTGAMLAAVGDPGNVRLRRGKRGEVLVFGAPRSEEMAKRLTYFVAGRKTAGKRLAKAIRAQARSVGKRATIRTLVPPRDFFGLDPAVVDAAANAVTENVFTGWGFKRT